MHTCRAAITVGTTAGLLLLGPTAWADSTPTPDASVAAAPAPTAQPTADATAAPTDAPTDDAASAPFDAPTDDATDVPVDNQGGLDPQIYEAGTPVGAVHTHVQKPELPFTGAPLGALTAGGLGLIALGGASILLGRRRAPSRTS